MENRILGKYIPSNTFIHRLDSRMKIISLILLVVIVFLPFKNYALSILFSVINLLIIFVIMILSKVKIKDLIFQLKTIWFMLLVLFIINILVPPNGSEHILIKFPNNFTIYTESLLQTAKIILRLFTMFGLAMCLTASTSPLEITYSFSFFLRPLKKIKFPSDEVAMTMSIALRFIPTLLEETNRIYYAQSSRGIDFKKGNIKQKFKGIVSLIIPLFVSCFTMSDDLALALQARGYIPNGNRTSYTIHKWKLKDTISIVFVLIYLALFITLVATKFDILSLLFPKIVWF